MHPHRRQNLIGEPGGRGGLPRRRLLQVAGALGLAATLRPTAVFADPDDEGERFGPFGPWSTPVNLGPLVNTRYSEGWAAISKNGLSLYITLDRPGGVNGKNLTGFPEMWVSLRTSLDADWGPPVNLDAFNRTSVINVVDHRTAVPSFSADGHLMFFNSDRPGGLGGNDLYVSRRSNNHDDFGWQEPVNLNSVNSPQDGADPDVNGPRGTPDGSSRTVSRDVRADDSRLFVLEVSRGVIAWAMMGRSVPQSSSQS